jgi:Tol biopolymer transport system component
MPRALLPARGGAALKLTSGPSIDAQPAWAPQGALYFVSDRNSSRCRPQVARR